MKSSFTLFAILAFTAVQAQAFAAPVDPSLSGVPLNVARGIVQPTPTASTPGAVDVAKSGLPLFAAKSATQPTAAVTSSSPAQPSGMAMSRATRQSTQTPRSAGSDVVLGRCCDGAMQR